MQAGLRKGEPMASRGHIENGAVVLDEPVAGVLAWRLRPWRAQASAPAH